MKCSEGRQSVILPIDILADKFVINDLVREVAKSTRGKIVDVVSYVDMSSETVYMAVSSWYPKKEIGIADSILKRRGARYLFGGLQHLHLFVDGEGKLRERLQAMLLVDGKSDELVRWLLGEKLVEDSRQQYVCHKGYASWIKRAERGLNIPYFVPLPEWLEPKVIMERSTERIKAELDRLAIDSAIARVDSFWRMASLA